MQKDERIIAAVQFEIKLFEFFYRSKQLADNIYTDIYRLCVHMNIILSINSDCFLPYASVRFLY